MHDCGAAQEQLIDLIFEELDAPTAARLRDEVESCPSCRAEFRAMAQSMRAFDQAAERVAPAEGYWPGYEARLRARLAEDPPSGLWARLTGWMSGFALPSAPVSFAAAAVVALALLLGGWWWMRQPRKTSETPAIAQSDVKKIPPSPAPPRNIAKEPVRKPLPRQRRAPVAPAERNDEIAAMAIFPTDAARHFEKAQLLLRAVRNADVEMAYEKQQSRRLLYQNILLRRDAEARGNLPAENVLGALEPLLLDIANLPDRPSPDAVREIRERIARQEMIAVLQTYATPPASFASGQE
ncbi:MAG: hypothetical protein SF339_26580 [Blastocatellia bacterium]|nr:hypothetical protein [Blastocatellia bacterium]